MQATTRHGSGRNTASLLFLELIFRGGGFVVLIVLSRTLAAEQIGSYFFIISLASPFPSLPFPSSLSFTVARTRSSSARSPASATSVITSSHLD